MNIILIVIIVFVLAWWYFDCTLDTFPKCMQDGARTAWSKVKGYCNVSTIADRDLRPKLYPKISTGTSSFGDPEFPYNSHVAFGPSTPIGKLDGRVYTASEVCLCGIPLDKPHDQANRVEGM